MAIVNFNSVSGVSTISATSSVTVGTGLTITTSGVVGITSINDGPISGARNRIINGDCRIDQRYAGASAQATDGGYFIDRWSTILNNGNFSVQGNAGNVTPPVGFTSYFGATVTTAAGSITGTSGIRYKVEGYNIADFAWGTSNAKTITMSFWVYSSLTGSFGGAIWNSAQTYSYPFLYTVSQANTWTYIVLTIPGSTNGTWLSTNGVGMGIDFSMGTGGGALGTAGAWVAGYRQGATGQVNHLSTLGATLYITGLQVELGTVATAFERRSFGQELALCQRYYEKSFDIGTAPANGSNTTSFSTNNGFHVGIALNATSIGTSTRFAVVKRAAPNITQYGNSSGQWAYMYTGQGAWSWGTLNPQYIATSGFYVDQQVVNQTMIFVIGHWAASAEL